MERVRKLMLLLIVCGGCKRLKFVWIRSNAPPYTVNTKSFQFLFANECTYTHTHWVNVNTLACIVSTENLSNTSTISLWNFHISLILFSVSVSHIQIHLLSFATVAATATATAIAVVIHSSMSDEFSNPLRFRCVHTSLRYDAWRKPSEREKV